MYANIPKSIGSAPKTGSFLNFSSFGMSLSYSAYSSSNLVKFTPGLGHIVSHGVWPLSTYSSMVTVLMGPELNFIPSWTVYNKIMGIVIRVTETAMESA